MQKIPIIITNGKKSEIVKELESSDFDLNQIEISESIRGRIFVYRIKFIWFSFKSSIQHFLRRTKEFIKLLVKCRTILAGRQLKLLKLKLNNSMHNLFKKHQK